MQVKGRLQGGMFADIAVFDPDNVIDNGAYAVGENGLPSTGISCVLINGVIIVRESPVQKGDYPGQPIRCAAEAEGRFECLARECYLDNLLAPVDFADEGIGRNAK